MRVAPTSSAVWVFHQEKAIPKGPDAIDNSSTADAERVKCIQQVSGKAHLAKAL